MYLNEIISEYEAFVQELEIADLDYEVDIYSNLSAMEARGNINQDSNDNGEGAKNDTQNVDKSEADTPSKLSEKASELGDTVNSIFKMMNDQIRNFVSKFRVTLETLIDKSQDFKGKYLNARQKYLPKDKIVMIMYEYKDEVLKNAKASFNGFLKKSFNQMLSTTLGESMPKNSIFEVEDSVFEAVVFNSIGAPDNIKTLKDYEKHIASKYRGRSLRQNITVQHAPRFEGPALSESKAIRATLRRDENEAYLMTSKIITNLKLVRNNRNMSDEVRTRAKKYAKRAARLERMYNAFLEYYYRLRIEKVVSCRNVLKSLYGI